MFYQKMAQGGIELRSTQPLCMESWVRFHFLRHRWIYNAREILVRTHMGRSIEVRIMFAFALAMALASGQLWAQSATVGIFANHSDVGTVLHPGSVDYD